jgi:3-hydroxyacyl-CoA dehydrogenase
VIEMVRVEWRGRVALVTIDNPPANALTREVRAGLERAFERLEADTVAQAVVLKGTGAGFATGPDVADPGAGAVAPELAEVCDQIESSSKPVIACLKGAVRGGGLELALAAHWRLASATATFGLPEVRLGLLPSAGGTQRVPRLCGAAAALDLMLSGRPITAEAAEAAGLVDGMLQGDVEAAAIRLAEDLAEKGIGVRPTGERRDGMADPVAYLEEVARQRAVALGARGPAERRIVDCVEAALLLPAQEGMRFERTAYEECLDTPESRALRHAVLAERRAAKVPELAQGRPRAVARAGVLGGGGMGSGIAIALLDAGLPVVLVERDAAARDAAVARIEASYLEAVDRKRLREEAAVKRLASLTSAVDAVTLGDCDFVIEAVTADPEHKRQLCARLEEVLAPGAVLATSSAELSIDELAQGLTRPTRVLGLHFYPPAAAMRAVEVVVGRETSADAVATAFALARRLGKIPVRSSAAEGLIGTRVHGAYRTVVDFLLEDGASVEEIDAVMRGAGFLLGPYQLDDLAGLDSASARLRRLAADRNPAMRYVAVADRLREAGRLGRRAGRGYYRYDEAGRPGQPDAEVAAIVAEERARKGIVPRKVGPAEIRRKALAAMANEGARLVAEGVALRPSDVDVVMLHGFGFPRWLGGPMQWADETGLLALRADLRAWAAAEPGFWTPAPLWDELIKNGQKFADLGA